MSIEFVDLAAQCSRTARRRPQAEQRQTLRTVQRDIERRGDALAEGFGDHEIRRQLVDLRRQRAEVRIGIGDTVRPQDVALALEQALITTRFQVDLPAVVAPNAQPVAAKVGALAAAFAGAAGRELAGEGAKSRSQHDVDHALVGAVAVFERHFLGQDVGAQDGLGRQIADLREAGYPHAVQ